VSTAGIWAGLATAGDEPPPPDYNPDLEEAPEYVLERIDDGPLPLLEGEFIGLREQVWRGVIRDFVCHPDRITRLCPNGYVRTQMFRGWLSGLGPGIKMFLIHGEPDGELKRVSYEIDRLEEWQEELRMWEIDREYNPAMKEPRPIRPEPWSGVEPNSVLPPLPPAAVGLRGGADCDDDDDSNGGPAGPHKPRAIITGHQVLVGTQRVKVHRIMPATPEESRMDVDVEEVSSGPDFSDSEADSMDSDGEPIASTSKPQKRGRGRPRNDGSGPFREKSPTTYELVRDAFEGQVPAISAVDLVPIAERPAARRAGGRWSYRLDTSVPLSGRA